MSGGSHELARALVIVVGTLAVAAIITIVAGGTERTRRLLDIVIGVASTFAGVFLGLGLDNVKKDHEDHDLAAASLRAAIIEFVEEMRPWFDQQQKFPAIALTTPNVDQRRIFFQTFQEYISVTPLEAPNAIGFLSSSQVTKSFDKLFLVLLSYRQTQIKSESRIVTAATRSIAEKYRSYRNILELSTAVYGLMCMQSSLLDGRASHEDFNAYLSEKMTPERDAEIGCSIPQFGPAALFEIILSRARAAAKSVDQGPSFGLINYVKKLFGLAQGDAN